MALTPWYSHAAGRDWVRHKKVVGKLTRCYDMLNDLHYFVVRLKGLPPVRFETEEEAVAYMETVSEVGDLK